MTVPLKEAQERGVKTIAYLDDFIVWASSKELCQRNIQILAGILEEKGLIINTEKSQLIPSQTIDWLDYKWDTRITSIRLPVV